MRSSWVAFRLATAAMASTAMLSPVSVAIAAPAPSVAGSWKGPFLSTNFTFEFTQTANGWTGRYQSEKYGKWVDLQNVAFANGTLTFIFPAKPPAPFTLKVDRAGKALSGTAKFGPSLTLPLTLARAS